jgi:hypothetical protein
MREWLRDVLARRPGWMNALLGFCAYMSVVYMPFDFFVKPIARDEEVWFGVVLTGLAAKATEPLHWAVYAAGTYGFWRMRPWLWPWAALYAAQVAIAMALWPVLEIGGAKGLMLGAISFVPFAALSVALWKARDRFQAPRRSLRERYGEWALRSRGRWRARASRWCSARAVANGSRRSPPRSRRNPRWRRASCRSISRRLGAPNGSRQRWRIWRSPCSSTTPASAARAASSDRTSSGSSR